MNMRANLLLLCAFVLSACACAPEPAVSVVAHRGFWNCEAAGFSQNSLASLRCAQEAGFWGSEFDVQLTSDDSLVVFHDSRIGDTLIVENPWSAIAGHRLPNGEKIPSLDEYLEQASACATTTLVFEIKETPSHERNILLTQKCVGALKAHGLYDPSRVIFISFCQDICEYLGENAPGFVTEALSEFYDSPEGYVSRGIRGVDLMQKSYLEDSGLAAAHMAAGLRTNVWTVNDMEKASALMDMGIQEFTSDVPDQIRATIAEKGLKELKIK